MPLHNNDLGIQYQWNSSLTEWRMRNAVQQMLRRRKTNKKITPMVSVYLRTNITVLVVYVVYCQCSECIVSEERSIDRWSSSTSSSILPGNISSLAGTLLSIAVSRTYLVANEIQKSTHCTHSHRKIYGLYLSSSWWSHSVAFIPIVAITEPPVLHWSMVGSRGENFKLISCISSGVPLSPCNATI